MSDVAVQKRIRTNNVDFVTAYQTSNSLAEVAQKLGITEGSVTQRRYSLQKQAKDLGKTLNFKKFSRVSGGDRQKGLSVEKLAELETLAESFLAKSESSEV